MTAVPPTSERLVLLDGLRGLAAIGTVLFHVNLDGSAAPFSRGYLFVDLFFLLSGFVLTLTFEPRFVTGLDWRTFIAARFRRFWPLAAAGSALGGVTLYLGGMDTVPLLIAVACGMTMLPIIANGMLYPANAPQWSLLVELLLNLVHAAVLQRLEFRTLAIVAGVLGAAVFVGTCLLGQADHGANAPELPFALLRGGWSYCVGVLMARRWRGAARPPLCDWRLPLVLPVVHVVALAFSPVPRGLGDALTVILVFPALFWLAVRTAPPPAAYAPLARLGAVSFPLYALHFPLILLWQQVWVSDGTRLSALPLVLIIATCAAWLLPGTRLSAPRSATAAAA